jgi:alpha-1,3-rhamnosyltransferase
LANKLSFLVPFLEEDSSLAAVFGGVLYIDDTGNSLDAVKSINSTHVFDDLIMGINIPSAPASVIKRNCILEVGKYDQSIGIEDWFLWLKLTEKGWCLKTLDAPVVKYRRHLSNMTNSYKKMHENRMLIVRHFENHYIYSQARSNLYMQAARESATHEVVYPLRMIMKAKLAPLSLKMLVLVKVITPKWLIVLSRRFRDVVA